MKPTGRRRLVIIDDSPEDRAELRRLLQQASEHRYTFFEAEDAAQGVRAVRTCEGGPPDCVILDYDLPDAKGDEVLAQLRGDDGVLLAPVVVVTGQTGPEIGHRALRAGAEDFVGKAWMTADSLVHIVENAVERWTMARELRASEVRFRHLAAAVPQAMWMLDAAGELIYANDRWHACFGEPAKYAGARYNKWSHIHHPDERAEFLALAARRVPYQRDCRLRGADGQFRWYQVNGIPILDASGKIVHWYGVNTDIHHRKMAEQRLAVQHEVSRILAHVTSFADAVPALLRAMGVGLGMDVCALWMPDGGGTVLRCCETFDTDDPRLRDFVAQTRTMTCAIGVDLPGQVWQSGRAERLAFIATSERDDTARSAGLASGAAYPVTAGEIVLGVIEMFSTSVLPIDVPLQDMLSAPGNELGQFILRKRAERAVEDNEARLRLALEASRTGIWTWDLQTDGVDWTPECYDIHGLPPGSFAGTSAAFFLLVHPDDRDHVEATVRAAIAAHEVYACEFRVVRPSGAAIWVYSCGRTGYAADGTPLQILGTLTDIDERKRITEELARSEERLARAQRAARVGTWDWNILTGEANWTDEAWRVFRGSEPDGRPITYARWLEIVHPDDREQVERAIRAAQVIGRYRDEFRVCHATGATRWVEAIAEVVFDAQGAPARMIGTARDVTERREADRVLRAALDEARKAVLARDQLVSLISHDLRNPLGSLSMELELLKARAARPDDALQQLGISIERMGRQVVTMTRMISEMLDAALIHAGKPLQLELRETDLVELTRKLVAEHQRSAHKHQIEVRAATERVIGLWDPMRIERAVDNLLSNAIKYSPRGGRVTIDITAGNGIAVLRIEDNGIGILPADQARVFDWFTRGENAKQIKIPGTGIGLAGAKQIVELHGGSISLYSEAGHGATFILQLPTSVDRHDGERPALPPAQALQP
jgi:PAS domain S-box-containing protein